MDMLFMGDGADGTSMTVLASTTNAAELKTVVKPALDKLISAAGGGTGMATDYANTDELDPDIFLWLLYKDAHERELSPEMKLSEIGRMSSRNGPIWRSSFSKGASIYRADILALIAKGNSVFGPAKFSVSYSGKPEGFFEIVLNENLSFSVIRTSEYDDEVLSALPEPEVGPRMVEDVWEILIPAIRLAHSSDKDWHLEKRTVFINECREAVHKL
ncbi:hypothetical protein [Mycobacterium sp. SM3041]|uniref:hypothetical protein n=1 Tax=Mycobacterium sp. SM3041 TaxID=3114291 RepID=UPI003204DDEB